jgi:hypothetical protein
LANVRGLLLEKNKARKGKRPKRGKSQAKEGPPQSIAVLAMSLPSTSGSTKAERLFKSRKKRPIEDQK